MDNNIGSIVLSIFSLLLIIGASYGTSRWIATKSARLAQGKYMRIVDKLAICHDKWIALIQLGPRVYMVAINGQRMEPLGEIPYEDLVAFHQEEGRDSFQTILHNCFTLFRKDQGESLSQLIGRVGQGKSHMAFGLGHKKVGEKQ